MASPPDVRRPYSDYKARTPSWTDRVLVKPLDGHEVSLVECVLLPPATGSLPSVGSPGLVSVFGSRNCGPAACSQILPGLACLWSNRTPNLYGGGFVRRYNSAVRYVTSDHEPVYATYDFMASPLSTGGEFPQCVLLRLMCQPYL